MLNIKKELEEGLEIKIISAEFVTEEETKFLKIILDTHDFNELTKQSNLINDYLDKIESLDFQYFTDIQSRGTDIEFEFSELKQFTEKNIQVFLKTELFERNNLVGTLLEFDNESLLLKWNKKGQIKKTKIEKDNILKMKRYIKIGEKNE